MIEELNRIPNTVWITPVNENLDWQPANDPCALELGGSWRLPANSEWTNVDATGGWTNWDDAWDSGLKLHAAGYLQYDNGSMTGIGVTGYYWAGSQHSPTHGWALNFSSGSCFLNNNDKAFGYTIRCVKDN